MGRQQRRLLRSSRPSTSFSKKVQQKKTTSWLSLSFYILCIGLLFCIYCATKYYRKAFAVPVHINTTNESNGIIYVSTSKREKEQIWPIKCSTHYEENSKVKLNEPRRNNGPDGKTPTTCVPLRDGMCDRIIKDDFLTKDEIAILIAIADRGMNSYLSSKLEQKRRNEIPPSGPTIMDINSGYVLPSGSSRPKSIYNNGQMYSKSDYDLYRHVITKLKSYIESKFGLSHLYFTAPTFITREVGDVNWEAKTMHDEYWHVHSDKNNTKHYDYSGLIYLSEQGKDFTGGSLEFYEYDHLNCEAFVSKDNPGPCKVTGNPTMVVAPVPGRLIVFGSGRENPHRVTLVKSGVRYVLSFWFTCNQALEFANFLDGKMHNQYKNPRNMKYKRKRRRQSNDKEKDINHKGKNATNLGDSTMKRNKHDL
jgi:hypothetical protein